MNDEKKSNFKRLQELIKTDHDCQEVYKLMMDHNTSSYETLERFDEFNDKFNNLSDNVNNLSDTVNGYCDSLKSINGYFLEGGIIPRIEEHVKETNGKVALNSRWRERLIAGMAVIIFLFPTITGLFIYFLNDLKKDVSNEITAKINERNGEYMMMK